MSQAYYRTMFQEHGLSDLAIEKCSFAANLIVSCRVEQMLEDMNPPKIEINWSAFMPKSLEIGYIMSVMRQQGIQIYKP